MTEQLETVIRLGLNKFWRFHSRLHSESAKQSGFRLTKGWNGDIDRYSTLLSQSLLTLKSRSPWC